MSLMRVRVTIVACPAELVAVTRNVYDAPSHGLRLLTVTEAPQIPLLRVAEAVPNVCHGPPGFEDGW